MNRERCGVRKVEVKVRLVRDRIAQRVSRKTQRAALNSCALCNTSNTKPQAPKIVSRSGQSCADHGRSPRWAAECRGRWTRAGVGHGEIDDKGCGWCRRVGVSGGGGFSTSQQGRDNKAQTKDGAQVDSQRWTRNCQQHGVQERV